MPFAETDESCGQQFEKKSSGSDENYQTDEDFSDESFSDSIKRLKRISIAKSHRSPNFKKNVKSHICRLNVSLRNSKHNRHFRAKNDVRKAIGKKNIKNSSTERKKCLENQLETPKKGKRCRLGGKAKGKPPEEEHRDKSESDDDNDNYYFSRISLGYFQKFRDKSGASTSYEWHEEHTNPFSRDTQEVCEKHSEELELLELQRWGMTSLVYSRKNEALEEVEKLHPDSL